MTALDLSKYYSTGKPCRNGHMALRRVSDSVCIQCEHDRSIRWKDENREHVRERDRRQRAKNPEKRRAEDRSRYAADPSKFIDKQKRFYAANSVAIRARRQDYHYETYLDPNVRQKAQQRTKEWMLANPEKAKANARNGKARRRQATGAHTADDISQIFAAQRGKCAYCRKRLGSKFDVDHINPVAKGGTNDRKNIQITCGKCNRAKSARDPLFHARTLGLLL